MYIKVKQPRANNIDIVIEKIKCRLENDVRHQILISMEEVDYIKDDKGKIRYIISELTPYISN